jgi:hypothetical protein
LKPLIAQAVEAQTAEKVFISQFFCTPAAAPIPQRSARGWQASKEAEAEQVKEENAAVQVFFAATHLNNRSST